MSDTRLRELERLVFAGGPDALDAAVSLAAAYGRLGRTDKVFAVVAYANYTDPHTVSLHFSLSGARLALKDIILHDLKERKKITGPGEQYWRDSKEHIQNLIDRISSGEFPVRINRWLIYPDKWNRYTSDHTHTSYAVIEQSIAP